MPAVVSDLFDESPRQEPASHLGAVSPLTPDSTEAVHDGYLALRWRAAAAALIVSGLAAFLMHFPIWAIATAGLLAALMGVWPIPRRFAAIRGIVLASFFFAQLTSIFVTPFTWPMRFAFCGVLISVPFVIQGRDLD
jgi:hypothetical protein